MTPELNLTGTVVAITGHRPNKLGNDYLMLHSPLVKSITNKLIQLVNELKPDYMVSGMALGIDTLWARIAVSSKIPLIAAVPFQQQDCKWPAISQDEYRRLLSQAHMVVNVSGQLEYKKEYMQLRNEWMVDHCDKLIAVWDRSPGGTANCVRYAQLIMAEVDIIRIDPTTFLHYKV